MAEKFDVVAKVDADLARRDIRGARGAELKVGARFPSIDGQIGAARQLAVGVIIEIATARRRARKKPAARRGAAQRRPRDPEVALIERIGVGGERIGNRFQRPAALAGHDPGFLFIAGADHHRYAVVEEAFAGEEIEVAAKGIALRR